jgi:hypothetical protein
MYKVFNQKSFRPLLLIKFSQLLHVHILICFEVEVKWLVGLINLGDSIYDFWADTTIKFLRSGLIINMMAIIFLEMGL